MRVRVTALVGIWKKRKTEKQENLNGILEKWA